MLVGCFREEEKVTVRRQWVSLSFFFCRVHDQPVDQADVQAGRQHAVWSWLNWSEDYVGGEGSEGRCR